MVGMAVVNGESVVNPLRVESPVEKDKENILNIESFGEQSTNLTNWLRDNKAKTDLDPKSDQETFVDPTGIVRFVDNWLPVSESFGNRREVTGCEEIFLELSEPNHFSLQPNQSSNDDKMRFITDWKLLWQYLENDTVDEIATHAPLLRIYVEFFFHTRTAYFVLILSIYNIAMNGFFYHFFPLLTPAMIVLTLASAIIQAFIYFSLRVLYKGTMLSDETQHKPQNTTQNSMNNIEESTNNTHDNKEQTNNNTKEQIEKRIKQ